MKNYWIYSVILTVLLSLGLNAQIMLSDDTYVLGGDNAGANYGSDLDLVIKRGTIESFFRKVLVKFDLRNVEEINAGDLVVVQLFASSMDAAIRLQPMILLITGMKKQ